MSVVEYEEEKNHEEVKHIYNAKNPKHCNIICKFTCQWNIVKKFILLAH